jgi:hypothetical protein
MIDRSDLFAIEDRVHPQLAELLQIPKQLHEQFFAELDTVIDEVRQDEYTYPKFCKAGDPAFRAIELNARRVRDAIGKMSTNDRNLVYSAFLQHLPSPFEDAADEYRKRDDLGVILSALVRGLGGLTGRSPFAGRAAGNRAVNDVKDWRFHGLMWHLFSWEETFGARLPFDPKKPSRTFLKTIALLDELAPRIIPAALPLSTIRDIRKQVRGKQKR